MKQERNIHPFLSRDWKHPASLLSIFPDQNLGILSHSATKEAGTNSLGMVLKENYQSLPPHSSSKDMTN